ncbi:MAG: hypothetical protein QOK28_1635 [Actinomycetota bacterium]
MRRVFAGAALIALGVAQLLSAGHSQAAAPTKVAWWNEAQQVPAPAPTIPSPPTSPEGGITVTNAPNGPAALGAVYYPVDDITGATLQLSSATPIEIPSGDGLLGCLVQTPGWQAGGNQRWDTKPAIDPLCTPGTLDATGMIVTFKLTSAFRDSDGAVDVAVVPTGQVPFTVNFDAPGASSLQVVAAPSTASDDMPTNAAVADFTPGEIVNGTTLFPDESQFAFAVPPPAPTAAPPEQALGGFPGNTPAVKAIEHPRKERIAVVLIVVGLLLCLWRLAGATVRAPRLLGSLGAREVAEVAEPAVAGIGRFARTRTSRPRRIS